MVDDAAPQPALLTTKQASKLLGISDSNVRQLIKQRRIDHVRIGKRSMIRRDRLQNFIDVNTVTTCPDETQALGSAFSTSVDATTLSGQKAVAAASAARARQIANKLSKPSPSSFTPASGIPGRVIPLKSS
ncbi:MULTISPECIES: helix-turn-helix domain-containing protein [unclassified Bradyrhizobium]|uniref:helix-turn-helix domain-containing protein n=1 Tax=unclassified Bradyrhizobium TaxID=2631580 RepID=UPI0033923EA3